HARPRIVRYRRRSSVLRIPHRRLVQLLLLLQLLIRGCALRRRLVLQLLLQLGLQLLLQLLLRGHRVLYTLPPPADTLEGHPVDRRGAEAVERLPVVTRSVSLVRTELEVRKPPVVAIHHAIPLDL